MQKWAPSLVASSAIYVARKIMKRPNAWSQLMTEQTTFDERMVRDCAKDLCFILNQAPQKTDYASIIKKFSLAKFMEVAKIRIPTNTSANTTNGGSKTADSN